MNMKRLILLGLSLLIVRSALAWGQKGHDVTAYIAECHLTPAAAKKIDKVLDGHSPVYYANWLDNASHTPDYAYTKTWHYLNVDEGKTLETMPANPKGDVLKAVTEIVAKLKAGGLTHEEEALQLKMLIHLVGDMHCPMHLGRSTDLGGNKRPVRYFGRSTNLHSVWDTSLVEWAAETCGVCRQVYEATPEGANLSYDYVAAQTPVVEQQFLRGGLRLARLLNEIYR